MSEHCDGKKSGWRHLVTWSPCHLVKGAGPLSACLLVCLLGGCGKKAPEKERIHVRPKVKLVRPGRRTITRTTGQPGFIEAYEQTAIYPKVSGFIDEWKVDIGDRITKGEEMAHIFVPELEAELQEKQAQVKLDEVNVRLAGQAANVAEQNYKAAAAQVLEAKAQINKYQADVARWQSQLKRMTSLAGERVVDPQVLDETRQSVQSSTAARDAARATAAAAEATAAARKAGYEKAKVDIQAARARAVVSEAGERRLAALVSYTRLLAPYDGVVLTRNVNAGDYVQPTGGDLTGARSLQGAGGSGRGAPLYVVARTDRMRIFLDVPEMEASGVGPGSKAVVGVQAVSDEEISASVTRTSWGLSQRTRTLRAEIDVPNPGRRLLPNMYAYGEVEVRRAGVWALPMTAVTQIGNQNCSFFYEDGTAVQTPVQLGIYDGKWVEVAKKRVKGKWVAITGKERVIEADLADLADGQRVRVGDET